MITPIKYVAYTYEIEEEFLLMVSEDKSDRSSIVVGVFNSPAEAREYIETKHGKENVRWLKD